MPQPENGLCTDEFYKTMKKCWSKDPACRPTFAFLYDYFQDFCICTEEKYNEPH